MAFSAAVALLVVPQALLVSLLWISVVDATGSSSFLPRHISRHVLFVGMLVVIMPRHHAVVMLVVRDADVAKAYGAQRHTKNAAHNRKKCAQEEWVQAPQGFT